MSFTIDETLSLQYKGTPGVPVHKIELDAITQSHNIDSSTDLL